MFVSLPTGFGKSVIYQSLPMVFDEYSGQQGHIVIVISPLLSLMEDQVKSLRNLGIKTISVIHLQNEDEIQKLEKGNYSVVYATQKCC